MLRMLTVEGLRLAFLCPQDPSSSGPDSGYGLLNQRIMRSSN